MRLFVNDEIDGVGLVVLKPNLFRVLLERLPEFIGEFRSHA